MNQSIITFRKWLDWENKPALYKQYPGELARIELEQPDRNGGDPLFNLIQNRRSERRFLDENLPQKIISSVAK